MRAVSILGTLDRVRQVVADQRDARMLVGDECDWVAVGEALDAVCDLVEICTASLPIPSLGRAPTEEADEAVAAALDELYGGIGDTALRPHGGQGEAVSASPAAAGDRLRTVGGHRIVPLDRSGAAAANWYVLYDRFQIHAAAVSDACRSLVDRHRLHGERRLADAWEGVADLLKDLLLRIERHVSVARWTRTADHGVAERAETVRAVAKRLNTQMINFQ